MIRTKEQRQRRRQHLLRIRRVKQRRMQLIEKLGGQCSECPCRIVRMLEFHHINPRQWVCRDKSRWVRIRLYEEEAARGEIKLLCRSCNAMRGKPDGTGTVLPNSEVLAREWAEAACSGEPPF